MCGKIKIGLLLTGLIISVEVGIAKQIEVAPNEANTALSDAILKAEPYDTLLISRGRYLEHNLTIDKPLTIIGENRSIVDGEGKGFVIIVNSDDVTIRGIEVHRSGRSFMEDYAGILVEKSSNTVIEKVTLVDNYFGIYLSETSGTFVKNNMISASGERETTSGNGIHLWYSRDVRIEDNHVQGHRDGLYFEFVKDVYIADNYSKQNLRYGLHFMYSDNCRYERNTIRNNKAGVAVMYTKNVVMLENRFEDNWGSNAYGLLLKEINRSRIEGNYFSNNSVAVYVEASSRNRFSGNNFVQNGWAVKLMANSTNNRFTGNNFIANSFEVATNSRQNFNEFDQNYWSQYEGYDLDRNGVGDVPYQPVKLFSVLVEKRPQALLLLRSLLIDILNAAERFMPVLTPETLVDTQPKMSKIS